MKRLVTAGVSLAALVAAMPASAADLPYNLPYKAPAAYSVFNWTGFYVGIHGGYAWASSSDLDLKGGFIGGQVGYNWQAMGSPWVFGIELDSAWADIGRNSVVGTGAGVISVQSRAHYMGSLRPRIGYSWDRTMLYATGGLAWINNRVRVNTTVGGFTAGVSDTQTHLGGTIGAGLEHAFSPNLTGKIEYLYTGYSRETYFSSIAGGFNADASAHTVKAGINYLFR